MIKTLVLLFHPDLARSRANAALASGARQVPGVEIVDMHSLYPDGAINVDGEVARLLTAGRLVLQFPVQWYSPPPLLRVWQDTVLTRMFYVAYPQEGAALEGTPLMIAATAGNTKSAYRPNGVNLFKMIDLLAPLRAFANRCRLPWADPFIVYEAMKATDAELAKAAEAYVARLRRFGARPEPSHASTTSASRHPGEVANA